MKNLVHNTNGELLCADWGIVMGKNKEDIADYLYDKAAEKEDNDEIVLSGEIFLLRKVFEASSNFKKSKLWDEFSKLHPPEETQQALFDSVSALERYFNDFK